MSFILTLTGPSCAGKTTLEKRLKQIGFEPIVSTTTRKIREGEVNGQNYYYVTPEEFGRLISADALVEHIEFGGNAYGITRSEIQRVLNSGKPIVIVLEPEGLKQVKQYAKKMKWKVFSVFVDNPADVIAHRFIMRLMNEKDPGAVAASYANRMASMMTTEMMWRKDAYSERYHADETYHDFLYDVLLERFDETNGDTVVAEFMSMLLAARQSSLIA